MKYPDFCDCQISIWDLVREELMIQSLIDRVSEVLFNAK